MMTADIENTIAAQVVTDALALGYLIDVHDGEDNALRESADQAAILAAMFSTDSDILVFHTREGRRVGFVMFIWGNGCDVLSDWSDKSEVDAILRRALELSEQAA